MQHLRILIFETDQVSSVLSSSVGKVLDPNVSILRGPGSSPGGGQVENQLT